MELVTVSIQVHTTMTQESQAYAEDLQTNNYTVPKRREEGEWRSLERSSTIDSNSRTYNKEHQYPIVTNRTDDRKDYRYFWEGQSQVDKYLYNPINVNLLVGKREVGKKDHHRTPLALIVF